MRTVSPVWPIIALAVGGFAIGTTEFATMGVLPEIADGVGVSVPTAGHAISAYALGVVVGVPILSFFVAGLPRKTLLLALMGAYAVFNAASAIVSSYGLLLVARFLDGLPHGAYFGVASLVAANLVSEANRGRAVAGLMMGLSIANVVGVPAVTWFGQTAGWRAAYLACGALALLTVAMVTLVVPHQPGDPSATGRAEASTFFRSPQVWLTMAAGAIGFGGLFAVYSYIAPIVTDVSGLPKGAVPFFTLAFGLGMVVGTWAGGELAHWSVFRSLLLGGVGAGVALLAFWALAPRGWWLWPATVLVTALGSVLVVNLQLRLMDVAGDAVTLGAAMNHAALNVANALGAYLGGVVIDAGYGYRSPAVVGVVLSFVGVAILLWSATLHRRTAPKPAFADSWS
ncbi:MAG: MFS transporter [Nocardioides sp.]|uniref:MFS transporter n=1 Tax=Nocardioides sp. TaxID=35761 RepID=UPI0039E3209D